LEEVDRERPDIRLDILGGHLIVVFAIPLQTLYVKTQARLDQSGALPFESGGGIQTGQGWVELISAVLDREPFKVFRKGLTAQQQIQGGAVGNDLGLGWRHGEQAQGRTGR